MEGHSQFAVEREFLVLYATDTWNSAIHAAASTLSNVRVEDAGSARGAVRRLAARGSWYTHILVEPSFAGDMLPVLVSLSSGEPGSGTALVVVGDQTGWPMKSAYPNTRFVVTATANWLSDALAASDDSNAGTPDADLSVSAMRAAISDQRITTRYQPIVRLTDRVPLCLEVLARLDHAERGTLPPDLFVPQMEQAGLAWPLTQTVIRRAFAEWGDGKLAEIGLSLAVNFPLDVLLVPSALTWLEAQREVAGIPASSIVIELTESQPVTELAGLAEAAARLRALGYGLAIDDVGPHTREYRALLDLPFTALKLDKNLVREAPMDDAIQYFLLDTLKLARRAGLRIVAEGIRDAATWHRMASLGVDQAQGYLVGRPLPAEAVPLWLLDWRERNQVLADQTVR